MIVFVYLYTLLTIALLAGALFLHLVPRLCETGKKLSDYFCKAPGLDIVIGYFTVFPTIIGSFIAGWLGLGTALAAEVTALWLWITFHEFSHQERWQEARIHKANSKIVGGWRNHLALWLTTLAIPGFWFIRLTQVIIYPLFTKLVRFPKYDEKDWVNVSRHKFEGLVGYDLIWCLYCDWMTGVWSLGSEMLRNLESFWCPIRFYSDKKCINCQLDFPDLAQGWIAADGTMEEVEKLILQKHSSVEECAWFGHPSRGEDV